MRNLAYILLVAGFIWSVFHTIAAGPIDRRYCIINRQEIAENHLNTVNEVADAYTKSMDEVSSFAERGFFGVLLMLAGAIILDVLGRRDSTANKPPVL